MSTVVKTRPFSIVDVGTGQEAKLAMQELTLTGRLLPIGALLQVRHLFKVSETTPAEVIYAFGLPRDAALRRFKVLGEDFSVDSELLPTRQALDLYERGLEKGHLSTLVRQYRDGLVNLSVGNLRPGEVVAVYLEIVAGVELTDEGFRFRFPFTLAPCYHEQAQCVEMEPGVGEIQLPEEFGDVILPTWFRDSHELHAVGFDLQLEMPGPVQEISSPSHAIRVSYKSDGRHHVSLARQKDVPNRDLVLDVKTAAPVRGVFGGPWRQDRYSFAVLIPSTDLGAAKGGPRRVVFVLDRSGSMSGTTIQQAKRALEACLATLTDEDQFGIVAFDDRIEVLDNRLIRGDTEGRHCARQFLNWIDARGGTELASGVVEGAKLLGKGGGDLFLITDGQVYGTDVIIEKAKKLGARIHCLGIGSASQDRFLASLARETGGASHFLTPSERVDVAALELFNASQVPVARDLSVRVLGDDGVQIAPKPPENVYPGSPLLIFGESVGKDAFSLLITYRSGQVERECRVMVDLAGKTDGEGVALLQGARLITDMEATLPTGVDFGRNGRDEYSLKPLEELSRKYGLASRAMSLVAVVRRKGDEPGVLPKTVVVPVGMPERVDFGSYFLGVEARARRIPVGIVFSSDQIADFEPTVLAERAMASMPSLDARPSAEDKLMRLAGLLEPDGGMAGSTEEERWLRSALALFCFLAYGSTPRRGTYRRHASRLLEFLKKSPLTAADPDRERLLRLAESGVRTDVAWEDELERLLRGETVELSHLWQLVSA